MEAGMSDPRCGVVVEPGIFERWFLPAEPSGGGLAVSDGVDRSADPLESSEPHLVAHRIGEALGGPAAVDLVAVVVDPGVEVTESKRTVTAQDRSRRGP
jgi:hypothetical protein